MVKHSDNFVNPIVKVITSKNIVSIVLSLFLRLFDISIQIIEFLFKYF